MLTGAIALQGCEPGPPEIEADVLIIGAGIAGLSAALEASEAGATVTLLDMNSVGGGHAVQAGGLFMVDTPLQAVKGIEDSVDLAIADMQAWGEDADLAWLRRYVEASRPEVYDWLTRLGVEFALLMPAPGETSVPRFHFTRGTSVNVVVPMMRTALDRAGVRWRMNTEATGIGVAEDGTWEIAARNLRLGDTEQLKARSVVIATGGFEGNLERVRANWLPGVEQPKRLLNGAGRFATGSGLDLGAQAGAVLNRLNKQTIFVTGFPNPRDPSGEHGLLAMNPTAIFVDNSGRRFMNEDVPRKTLETTVLAMPGQSYWMIFDNKGRRRLQVRGAPWLDRDTLDSEILGNPEIVQRGDDIATLAAAAGLPPSELELTIAAYNAQVVLGEEDQFGRFSADIEEDKPPTLGEPPFYALRLYPMSRKSMGGLVIDADARVLNSAGAALAGLYAAGEATGVAGINGSHGGSGTFLGPSVFTGRIAGRTAARTALQDRPAGETSVPPAEPAPAGDGTLLDAAALDALLANSRPGYWHFEQAHALVREREWRCAECHGEQWPTRTAVTAQEKRAQLESCARCH
ncbi:MAG: FAD-dependent oxidoreductase [Chromatiales bacterium]|nr:MAG: FAD-dependent oxidoreductase [Chromatiales bacterium]